MIITEPTQPNKKLCPCCLQSRSIPTRAGEWEYCSNPLLYVYQDIPLQFRRAKIVAVPEEDGFDSGLRFYPRKNNGRLETKDPQWWPDGNILWRPYVRPKKVK